ncbi:hypothetical protein [Corynebacterium variabile]|uniref:hypothetical protein n=1 Tax=Corynebacterium variabile TaxID=1727 RepID=UPI0028A8910E|nr:hypothetical protein [Corynebacterium variabile]
MSTVNPHITDRELHALGWPPLVLQQLARDRARIIADKVMELAETELEWAPLRGMSCAEWMQMVDEECAEDAPLSAAEFAEIIGDSARTAAADLASYLALPADAGDDDEALVASVAAEHEQATAPTASPALVEDPDEPVDPAPAPAPTPEVDPEQVAREEQEAWDEREARVVRAEARAEKRRERLTERLAARAAAREDGF